MIVQLEGETARLYKLWCAYFSSIGKCTYVERVRALSNAQEGKRPPYFR